MGELSLLLDTLRKKGVVKLSMHDNGEIAEVLMGPDPAFRQINAKGNGTGTKNLEREERRSHYAAMLGRFVSDHELDNLP